MNIVQINCASFGSTGNIAKAIHHRLLEEGHNSHIFYGGGTSSDEHMTRIGGYFSLHSHAVLSRNLGRQGYFSALATAKLIRQVKKLAPDVVHLHNLHGSYVNLPMLFSYLKKSGVRVLLTLHDCWLFTGKCPHFTVCGCEKWKQSCGGCPQLSSYPRSKVDTTEECLRDKKKWLSGFGDRMRITTVSNWLRDTARQSFLAQYPIETVYNGIDCSVFQPVDGTAVRQKYHLEDRFVILGVSPQWNSQKGLDDALELSRQLTEDEVMVLVGLTAQQIAQMPDNIIGIERTADQRELAQLYSAANVFVNFSREETFGLVTAEAMACGTPAVVYDSTACPEVLAEGCGFVAQPHDLSSILSYIRTSCRKEEPSVCTQRIRSHFTLQQMTDRYLDRYKEV